MKFWKITRRRRITLLKIFLIGFAVLGVIFWFNQVHNVPSGTLFREKLTHLSSSEFRVNSKVSKNSAFDSKFRNEVVRKIIPIHSGREAGQDAILPQVPKPFLDHKSEKYENKPIKNNRQIVPPFNVASKSVLEPKNEVHWNKITHNYSDSFMKITPGLGENGAPVHLSATEQKLAEEEFNSAAFNVYISDRMALNRSVPDPRNPMCKHVHYDHDLPKASIIIIFTNEMWSALLRTIISVINRTPSHLLQEIILVDDFSDADHLKGRLDKYVFHKFRHLVKIIRLSERQGLVRARLAGAKSAVGDVLVFLDSHCEANVQWLEPLLQRIKENKKAVLCPIIDVIDDKTLEYYASNLEYFQIGGFTWSGHFTWIEIPEWEEKRRASPVSPTRTPTMAGGLFAIDRNYFWEVGSYDAGMDIWGGENLEMSFRVWMCGGVLEIVPCSHVGHIFRSFHPYAFPGNKDTHGINTVRTVEVWMDDYKKYFYMYRPDLAMDCTEIPQNTADAKVLITDHPEHIDYGDISDRIDLRKTLQCKSFGWYLKEIYPQKFILDQKVVSYGTVRNPFTNLCLDTLNRDEDKMEPIGFYPCKNQKAVVMNQMLSLTEEGELRKEENCAEVNVEYSKQWLPVMMTKCHGNKDNQEWTHIKGGAIVHSKTGKCLDASRGQHQEDAYVTDCHGGHSQAWWFENYLDIQLQIKHQQ